MPIIEISQHLVKLYKVLDKTTWKTSLDIAAEVDINPRTARKHLLALSNAGVTEHRDLFGGYKFRLMHNPNAAARKLISGIEAAGEAFGD